jgi:hypothetical protein
MKTLSLAAPLRVLTFATMLCGGPAFSAVDQTPTTDRAAQLLANHGALSVVTVGPYIERGTFRIQVSTKLGRPDLTLADGTWLYHDRTIDGTSARGTLVIRFEKGRVSELALATPSVVAALRADPRKPLPSELVATK